MRQHHAERSVAKAIVGSARSDTEVVAVAVDLDWGTEVLLADPSEAVPIDRVAIVEGVAPALLFEVAT